MPDDTQWDELDAAARANLSAAGLRRYQAYKADLLKSGHPVDFVEDALRGWIWDETEAQEDPT